MGVPLHLYLQEVVQMAQTVYDRINLYLEDAIATERSLESTLRLFAEADVPREVETLASRLAARAHSQHQRLSHLLRIRGGASILSTARTEAKTLFGGVLAFAPRAALSGSREPERTINELFMAFAANAAGMAMYESLTAAAAEAGEAEVLSLASTLRGEEHISYKEVWAVLREYAAAALSANLMADNPADAFARTPEEIIVSCLQHAIATGTGIQAHLDEAARQGTNASVQSLFTTHARETRMQVLQLTARLESLGGTPSPVRNVAGRVLAMAPAAVEIGQDAADRLTQSLTQSLIHAFATENGEIALYESLAELATAAGDAPTAQLARVIQKQQREFAERLWAHIAPNGRAAIASLRLAWAS
jgi:ferritin-like metal-binding protein YciE